MDFAKKILSKYGWKDGDGLGKNNDGMSKPLKANLKFDNAGFGADQAATDFNNHWWERVFNEAASNVAIKSDKDGVSMDVKNPNETVEITTKGYSIRKLKERKTNDKYENFLQSATLTKTGDEVEKADRITANEIEVKKFKQLTDDELFKACGGRTAHKGARHGLKLSGKLARLEMQEQEILSKMLAKKNEVADAKVRALTNPMSNSEHSLEYEEIDSVEKKKHKKSKRKGYDEPAVPVSEKMKSISKTIQLLNQKNHTEHSLDNEEIASVEKQRKRKKSKRKSDDEPEASISEETKLSSAMKNDVTEVLVQPLTNQMNHIENLDNQKVVRAEKKKKHKKSKRKSKDQSVALMSDDMEPKKKKSKKN